MLPFFTPAIVFIYLFVYFLMQHSKTVNLVPQKRLFPRHRRLQKRLCKGSVSSKSGFSSVSAQHLTVTGSAVLYTAGSLYLVKMS